MQQGDVFFGKMPKSGIKPHFWFVLTKPNENGMVVIVNVTTPDGPTKAQVLKKSTYNELEYDSIVYWPGSSTWSVKQLDEAIAKNVFKAHPPLGVSGVKEMVAEGEVRGLIKSEVLKELKAGGC